MLTEFSPTDVMIRPMSHNSAYSSTLREWRVLACLIVCISVAACSKSPRDPEVSELSAIDYSLRLPDSAVTYFLPPSGTLAAQTGAPLRKHYVEMKISNMSGGILKIGMVDA